MVEEFQPTQQPEEPKRPARRRSPRARTPSAQDTTPPATADEQPAERVASPRPRRRRAPRPEPEVQPSAAMDEAQPSAVADEAQEAAPPRTGSRRRGSRRPAQEAQQEAQSSTDELSDAQDALRPRATDEQPAEHVASPRSRRRRPARPQPEVQPSAATDETQEDGSSAHRLPTARRSTDSAGSAAGGTVVHGRTVGRAGRVTSSSNG